MISDDPRRFLPAAQFGEVRQIVPITMGLSGAAVYSVATTAGDFILRIHRGDRSAWDRTVAMQRLAAEHGVAPRIVYLDDVEPAAVSVQIAGMTFAGAAMQPAVRAAAFHSLVERLTKLHAIPPAGIPAMDLEKAARTVWDEQVRRPGFPAWAVPLGECLAASAKLIEPDQRKVFSHCDLNPANLLWDGTQVWLIDWEAASLAHPYLDLAIIANFLILPDEAALGLLAAQERQPISASEQSRFAAIRELARIIYGGVFLRLVPDLTAVRFSSHAETPTLGQCFALMAAGKLVLSEPGGQALIGAALLKQCALANAR